MPDDDDREPPPLKIYDQLVEDLAEAERRRREPAGFWATVLEYLGFRA